MNIDRFFDVVPFWVIYFLSVFVVLLSIKLGIIIANIKSKKDDGEHESSVGTVVGATLGLLAFILAFSFGMSADRFGARKQLLLDEVNAIETTYLRAGFFAEPSRSDIRRDIKKYVDTRAVDTRVVELTYQQYQQIIKNSEAIHTQLWAHAEKISRSDLNSDIGALFVESLNNLIELHTARLTVGLYRIPSIIWIVLLSVTILSMASVGYYFGRFGKVNWMISIGLALVFSVVILLIFDLDRTGTGNIKINQQPMINLQQKLEYIK
ncbi:MAG: DUF4239 domain-containing protein [Candidatus Auribacter fodinae]|jgi:hypothetical protein|uniref:DUF4239 domain-containing protein n=1 Tax=Candidatus Auribacter fodinae TaxID=2093366 RepID=A0A3A4QZB8_9BACT|nr:MAG: DUF4239 domain-containing protein [Candidatus Auribacter fodinae]